MFLPSSESIAVRHTWSYKVHWSRTHQTFQSLPDHDHWKRRTSEVVLRQLEPPVRAARRATPQAQRNKRNPSGALNFLSIKCQCEPCAPVLSSPLPSLSLSLSKTQPPPFLPARPNCTLAEKRSSVHLFKGAGTQRRRSHARQPVGLQSL